MQKSQIISFIKRYYLGNRTESAQWDTFEEKLEVPFITGEKTCMGTVRLNNFKEFEPGQTIGILNTTPLLRQLEVLKENGNITTSFTKLEKEGIEDRIASIEFTDPIDDEKLDPYSTKFMCADLKVVPRNTGLKKKPEWDLVFTLHDEFADKFIKAQSALETKEFQIMNKGGKYKILLGQVNTRNSTMGEVPVPVEVIGNDIGLVKFPAVEMKEILSANKGDIKLRVSGEGLAWIEVKDGDFECDYFLLSEG